MSYRVLVKFGFLLSLTGIAIPVTYCAGARSKVEKELNATARPADGHNRIIGGKQVSIEEYPFMVSIQLVQFAVKHLGPLHICGGTLLYPTWVLTAAHCALNMKNPKGVTIRKATRFSVVAGMTTVNVAVQRGRQFRSAVSAEHRRRVNETHINEYFHPTNLNDDIALMRLSTPFDIGAEIQLVKMPVSSTYKETNEGPCFAIGWGKTVRKKKRQASGAEDVELPKTKQSDYRLVEVPLKDLQVEIQDFDRCKTSYGRWFGPRIFADRSICTRGDGGVFSGDSGGGLVCQGVQLGITSFVSTPRFQGDTLLPDVFTRIDFYVDWINATISAATSLNKPQMKWCLNCVAAYLLTTIFVSTLL